MATGAGERAELLGMLAVQRDALLITVRGLSDESAARRSTVSELTLGGLVKHVTAVERDWTRTLRGQLFRDDTTADDDRAGLRMQPGETLVELIDDYRLAARDTERAATELSSMDVMLCLPETPWFPPGTEWSARSVLVHLIRETAQHCGHADIIRESIDGASTTRQLGADLGIGS
ncbi:DinB family protein [Saccharopolyspora gloriosae]|uniref:DinB family protein n=1 Tax=Saccharopolyspora gloriosae TaxID=455344 RepID=UPI001FB5DA18|nr:DinB family protein [Saccharopolyspora gloriosae]